MDCGAYSVIPPQHKVLHLTEKEAEKMKALVQDVDWTKENYYYPCLYFHKIEYDALEKRTQLAFVVAWELANRKNRILVDADKK